MIAQDKMYKIIIGILIGILLFLSGQKLFVSFSPEARVNRCVEKAAGYYKYGAFDKAIEYYKKALEIKPNSANLHNDIGVFYKHSGRIEEALDSFNKAIEFDPNCANAYVNLGNIALDAHAAAPAFGFIYKSRDNFKKAIEVDPDCFIGYNSLGMAYNTLRLYDKAISAFEKAIEINPDYAEGYSNLANAYYALGMTSKSIETAQKAIELFKQQGNETKAEQLENIVEKISAIEIQKAEAVLAGFKDSPQDLESGKSYIGYTDFLEKDGFSPSEIGPPNIGDVKRRFMYAKYREFSDGAVVLSENYPLNLKYKIISVKEINSFVDKLGYTAHYYEVEFEPVRMED